MIGVVADSGSGYYAVLLARRHLQQSCCIRRCSERVFTDHICKSSCQVPVTLGRFYWNLNFTTHFRKILQISRKSIFWEPSCSMWADRRTETTKLAATFCEQTSVRAILCRNDMFWFYEVKLVVGKLGSEQPRIWNGCSLLCVLTNKMLHRSLWKFGMGAK